MNGERIKFHGVSLHHDHGALGAEENYKAEYRRLKQMKEMGVNSIRTTHNPASEQTLQIAAELGLLVQEEAFDTWYGGKKPYDYGRFFEKDATHPEAKKGENGLILTYVPWSKEAKTTQLSSCGQSEMKSVKQMGIPIL